MKNILIFAFAFVLTNTFGQTIIDKTNAVVPEFNKPLSNDTSVIVSTIFYSGLQVSPKTAYFLNDTFIKYSLLVSLNPELIESLNVDNIPIEIDSVKYERQIRCIAKNNYFPKAISLTNLKDKYYREGLKNEPVIFMIDGKIVHGDYKAYEIDENNLFAITLDPGNTKDEIKLQFVMLTTKSEANIKNFKSGDTWMRRAGVELRK